MEVGNNERYISLKSQIMLLDKLSKDIVKQKVTLEKELSKQHIVFNNTTVKKQILSYLKDSEFVINKKTQNAWKNFKPKNFDTNSNKHLYVSFKMAIAVWLAPLYTLKEIGEMISKDHSSIIHYYKTFLAELEVKGITGKVSEIEQYLIQFNQHVNKRGKSVAIN